MRIPFLSYSDLNLKQIIIALSFVLICSFSFSQELAPAPYYIYTDKDPVIQIKEFPKLSVNPMDRASVIAFYNDEYLSYNSVAADWTGSISECNPGTTSSDYELATMRRINYYRNMTNLPSLPAFDQTLNSKCYQAALMMIAEGTLSHSPGTSFECYTADGAQAAGKSNLALGSAGYDSIDLYIEDPGGGNVAMGHRRWVLFPTLYQWGTGSTTGVNGYYHGSNDLWVIGTTTTRPSTPQYVAWPPEGYVPYQVVYPRWTFSVNKSASLVDFANADVTMTHGGASVSLTVISKTASGFGDDTIVWTPSGIPTGAPASDLTYSVNITNVKVDGAAKDYSYNVTIINPENPGPTPSPTPVPTATPSPTPSQTPTPTPVPTPEYIRDGIMLH